MYAGRSCELCKQYLFSSDGRIRLDGPHGLSGNPIPRHPSQPTPCRSCPKIPEGKKPCPENAIELTPENRQALEHYLECKAVGDFPDDPAGLVRRDAAIIGEVLETIERSRRDTEVANLVQVIKYAGRKPR